MRREMLESKLYSNIWECDYCRGVYVCGHGKVTLTFNTTSSEQALSVSIINVNLLPLMSCLKFSLTALWQNTTRKRLWDDNIAYCRALLFGKRSQRSLFSTLQIGGGLINAGSPKEGRFCKTKRFVVVDGDGSLWHNMRLPSFQTRPTMRRIWSEMFLTPENNTVWKLWQLSIIYLSRIIMILTVKTTGKSRWKSATTQIRHNSEKRILWFFVPCD